MDKLKNFLLFLVFTLVILVVTVGVPTFAFLKYQNTEYYTYEEYNGNKVPSTFANIAKIFSEQPNDKITKATTDLLTDYNNIIKGKSKDLLNLYLCVSMMLGAFIIILGLVLIVKTKNKYIASSVICAGTVSTVIYMLIYYTCIFTLN